jgi:hypothetical protein
MRKLLIALIVSSCAPTTQRFSYPLLEDNFPRSTCIIEITKPGENYLIWHDGESIKLLKRKATITGELTGGMILDEKYVGKGKLYPVDPSFAGSFIFVGTNSVRIMYVKEGKIIEDKALDVKFEKPVVLVRQGIAVVEEDGSKVMFYKNGNATIYTPDCVFAGPPVFYFDDIFFASTDGKKLLIINFETLKRYDYNLEEITKESSLPNPKNLKLFGTFRTIDGSVENYLVLTADNWTRNILISEKMEIRVE